jgi:quercetin dioxygenase-like cupin family protein
LTNYHYVQELSQEIPTVPSESIVSRTLFQGDTLRAILFGFAAGQELSEHTASVPAIIHILSGEARLTLGSDSFQAQAGTWVHMQANLSHSLYAQTPVTMLLIMQKGKE